MFSSIIAFVFDSEKESGGEGKALYRRIPINKYRRNKKNRKSLLEKHCRQGPQMAVKLVDGFCRRDCISVQVQRVRWMKGI